LLIDAGSHPVTGAPPGSDRGPTASGTHPAAPGHPGRERPPDPLPHLAYQMREDLEHWWVPKPYPTAGRAIDYLLIDSRTGFAPSRRISALVIWPTRSYWSPASTREPQGPGADPACPLAQRERIPIDGLHRQFCAVSGFRNGAGSSWGMRMPTGGGICMHPSRPIGAGDTGRAAARARSAGDDASGDLEPARGTGAPTGTGP